MGNQFPCMICSNTLVMFSNTPCLECSTLIDAFFEALRIARKDGVNGPHAYTPNYWRTDPESHTEHALTHIFKHRRGDTTEDHLTHAICRLVMEYARNGQV